MNKKIRDNVFLIIRAALVLSIITNISIVLITYLKYPASHITERITDFSGNFESILWAAITLILTFGSSYIEKREQMDIPDKLEIIIILHIFAGIFLSSQFNLFHRFFWWDDLLHTLSGIIIGLIGFIIIYKINYKHSMNISPLLVAIFSFTFAVTLNVFWEILEFASDYFLGSAHQDWNLPADAMLIGKPYQGSGLRDTMSDLIVDCLGALITSLITYHLYSRHKRATLKEMGKMIKKIIKEKK